MEDIRTLKRMLYQVFHILSRKQKTHMIGIFFVILLGSLMELFGVSAMLPFIQSILTPEELMQKSYIQFFCRLFGISTPGSVILMVGIGIIAIYIAKNAYMILSAYLQARFNTKTQRELSVLMLRSYIARPYTFFVDNGSEMIIEGVNGDMSGVYQIVLNGFNLLSEILTMTSIAVLLILTDWILAIGILLVGLSCLCVIVFGLKNKISQVSIISRRSAREKYKWILQISGGIKEILVYRRQKFFLDGYEKASNDASTASIRYTLFNSLPNRLIEAFSISGIIITVLIRFAIGVDVDSFIPKMGVFAMGAFRLLPSVSNCVGYINAFVFYRRNVESAYENISASQSFQDEQSSWASDTPEGKDNEFEDLRFRSEIVIRDLQWKYKEGTERVLDGLNLSVKRGEAVGIIGESGSGKSTFADIILRLYHPQNGQIQMDGINIDSIPETWSRVIGFVPQDVYLIDDTVRENVVFGAGNPNDAKVWDALNKASLDSFIRELPGGLDTLVGEDGVKFSGGQRQRIAIARALYADPQILILDEATSALDNETEDAVMEAIDALAGTITMIIIAHRVTTLRNCNRIFEIVHGKAVERDKNEVIQRAFFDTDCVDSAI